MQMLTLPQPWASLLARGAMRFAVREEPTAYRGTIAIKASDVIDPEVVERLETDSDFSQRLASLGLQSASDVEGLPREAIVGVAVLADVWSMDTLEEVATEDDAILIGDVVETAVFWELVEAVEITAIADPTVANPHLAEPDEEQSDDEEQSGDEEPDVVKPASSFEPIPEALADALQDAATAAGARFDEDGLVFWPLTPSDNLATLIGDDAVGDREITRRVWAYVVEQDLQDPEDNAYVYLDDALRNALNSDADGMTTVEFGECINAQISERQA